jgi:hypothetical protein
LVYRPDHLTLHLQGLGSDLVCDGTNTGQFAEDLRLSGYRRRIPALEPLAEAHVPLEAEAAVGLLSKLY